MAVFEYRAMDMDGSAAVGTVIADTARQARDLLRDRGLTITQVNQAEQPKGRRAVLSAGRRGDDRTVTDFVSELATLLKAGIPLLQALQTLEKQHSRRFRAVVQELADQVAAGSSLAEAMRRMPGWFDELSINVVDVGENTGSLEVSLKRLADFKAKAHRLRSRLTTAMLYPAIVGLIGLAVTVFLMTYVVPQLLGALTEAGKDLPTVTRAVKAASDFLIGWWWALLAGALGVFLLIRASLATKAGREAFDRLVLKIPILGDLIAKENTSRMAIVLAALLRSGLRFVEAVRITRRTLKSTVFRKAMDRYEQAVASGRDVARPLAEAGVFKPMVVQMLAVGQQSGQLEDMLEQLAEAYEQQVDTAAARLTAMLEPLLIVALAILVGFIAFATILPILEASNVL